MVSLRLKSFEEGPTLSEIITIRISLTDYPGTKIRFEVELEYRECLTSIFEGNVIEKQRILIGSNPYQVPLVFRQSPCDFTIVYNAVVYDKENDAELPLPTFMSVIVDESEQTFLSFDTTDKSQIGEY